MLPTSTAPVFNPIPDGLLYECEFDVVDIDALPAALTITEITASKPDTGPNWMVGGSLLALNGTVTRGYLNGNTPVTSTGSTTGSATGFTAEAGWTFDNLIADTLVTPFINVTISSASFAGYTETSLTVSCFVYAMLSAFFLAIFLLKYRIEYLLLMPLIVALFGHYLALAMQPGSSAQKPEKLFRERGLMILVAVLGVLFLLLTFVNIPLLEPLASQRYISIQ